jgi:urease accessory protein
MLALLACGLAGSALGLILPGLPLAEALVAFSLVVEGMVLIGRGPRALLLPAFAVHGYVLSAAVIGWSRMPILAYLAGLLLSQGLLLLVSLLLLRRLGDAGMQRQRQLLAAGLIGCGLAWTWSAVVG